jgi:hypothetical protein
VPPLISYGSQTLKECCKGIDEYWRGTITCLYS